MKHERMLYFSLFSSFLILPLKLFYCVQGCSFFRIWLKTRFQAAFLMLSSLYIFTDKYKLKCQSEHWSFLVDKILVRMWVANLQIRSGSGQRSKMTVTFMEIICLFQHTEFWNGKHRFSYSEYYS